LDDAELLDELAAMLDGYPLTSASRENARTMLARVEDWIARHQPAIPTRP
jgi:DNA repair protein RecN (Recombination protein N)